jgi:hypothetical protein
LWAPPEKLVSNVDVLNRDLPSDHFIFATPQEFFGAAEETPGVPELTGSIAMGWPDIADGTVDLWQLASPATNILTMAEEFLAINNALGYAADPQADLDLLWKNLIESMGHNNGGQGGEIGDRRKKEDSEIVLMRGGEILRNMLRNIAERVRIPVAADDRRSRASPAPHHRTRPRAKTALAPTQHHAARTPRKGTRM